MDLGLTGRAYLVTGGSSGLGRATAQSLADDGASVAVSARSEEAVLRTAEELGDNAIGLVADNGDPQAAATLIERTVARFGRLDGLLVSVGGPPKGAFSALNDDQWRSSFDTILMGTVRLIREAVPVLKPGSAIALVLSSSVRTPITGLTLSNVFRPALAMLVKDLADELGPNGIRVLALLPGRIATPRTIELDAGNPGARERSEAAIPLRRLGEPVEFGRVAAFLLSPAASYVTGAAIAIDGGMIRSL
ncbi:MAG: 2-deoxy-D-gluconate 3-dehydrogenase [Microbacteriaceae bacterium]|nr:2-deoxy-D-gluconate 3-dehydrogenase [Microbacteriaceae bacterium]